MGYVDSRAKWRQSKTSSFTVYKIFIALPFGRCLAVDVSGDLVNSGAFRPARNTWTRACLPSWLASRSLPATIERLLLSPITAMRF
jgi:hypothetical protein